MIQIKWLQKNVYLLKYGHGVTGIGEYSLTLRDITY